MYQKMIVVGNLGRDPELQYTTAGQAVTNFSIATNRRYNSSEGEPVEETVWIRVSVWGKSAEACNTYLHKGSKVLVEGRLKPDRETGGPRVYERNDGTYGSSYEMTAYTVQFLSSKSDDNGYEPAVKEPEEIEF